MANIARGCVDARCAELRVQLWFEGQASKSDDPGFAEFCWNQTWRFHDRRTELGESLEKVIEKVAREI